MNTNIAGLIWFSISLRPCGLDESSLSIGRVKKRKRGKSRSVKRWEVEEKEKEEGNNPEQSISRKKATNIIMCTIWQKIPSEEKTVSLPVPNGC